MAKMIPDTIERNDPRRKGEYMVYDWISDPSIPGYCFYSLPQTNHFHKMIGEVDFLYICNQGMLCIEVKGGQEIYRKERKWYSVNKRGIHNEIHDPFLQSRDCMYALGRYLEEVYGSQSVEERFQRGYCVVFPECIAKCKGNDIVTEVMFDNRYDLSEFKSFINNSLKYWADKEVEKHFGSGSIQLTSKQVNQMVDLLQADFGSIPSMRLSIQNVERQMLSMSDEQMDVFENMRGNRRLLVQGGAGTGKSLMALAEVRHSLSENKRVLYVCFNKNMAQYARKNLPQNANLNVKTFHALIGGYLEGDTYNLSLEDLCREYAEKGSAPDKEDVLVIDEGQDLMFDFVWETIDVFLKGGMERGKWIIFTDPNQNIFSNDLSYQNGIEYIRELCDPAVFNLTKNWRNTAQIIRRTSVLTSVPLARYMKIDGPKVVVRSNISGNASLVKQLKKDISSLIMGGTSAKDIVILSTKKMANSALNGISEVCNLRIVEPGNLNEAKNNQINYYTIQSFKGLESSIVLYVDIDGFMKKDQKRLNYVAMTRAKALLYMYFKDELVDEYDQVVDEGTEYLET